MLLTRKKPNITDLLNSLGRFNTSRPLVGMAEDIPKTTLNTGNGLNEWCRMPFGLKNVPATFQRIMDNILRRSTEYQEYSILRRLQNEKAVVYLDDLIIYSYSSQEHSCSR